MKSVFAQSVDRLRVLQRVRTIAVRVIVKAVGLAAKVHDAITNSAPWEILLGDDDQDLDLIVAMEDAVRTRSAEPKPDKLH